MIELNDTLQITSEQGFPTELSLGADINLEDIKDKIFSFKDKPGARIFHPGKTRCFLVHNIDGKWLYWGKVLILEQTITSGTEIKTSGKFKIIQIYDKEYQKQITINESPEGMSYF